MCWPAPSSTATASATSGTLGAGDVQWMTAGSGIMHQEMPQGDAQGRMHGFQLWANLPVVAEDDRAALPGHPGGATFPRSIDDDGTRVRVVCGDFWGKKGPVEGVAADPRYLDVFGAAGQAQDACRSRSTVTPSPTCSRARARSPARRSRSAC